jgi:aryl-alcohol dehydrogenase-like predicted oxidoreductase
VLATKFGVDMRDGYDGPRGGRDYIQRAIAGSLERLRTDHVDIYYYHLPDGVTPIEETLEALHELVEDGRVRAIGCSNFAPAQLREADAVARAAGISRFVGLQNEYSLLKRAVEAELLPLCRELGVAFVPYFPLASGLLTGKYRRGEPPPAETRLSARPEALSDEALARVDALEAFARERGRSVLELAIAALASRPGVVSVIAGATRPDQVRANAAAADWTLDADDLDALERVAA